MARALSLDDPQLDLDSAGAPRLRLTARGTESAQLTGAIKRNARRTRGDGAAPQAGASKAPVLIAGGDAATRAHVRDELAAVMPGGIRFEELGTSWQLLARAAESRAVVLSGDLDDVAAESLMHALAHRHPDLPVVRLESAATPGA